MAEQSDNELEGYRSYLRLLGRMQIRGRMNAKIDLSGLVQQTMIEAHLNRDEWERLPDERQAAWLRVAFANNLRDAIRRFRAAARDVERERPIAASVEESASRVDDWLEGKGSSPSARAVRREEALRLADALEQLPEDQRTAIEMNHLQGVPLVEVAEHLERSKSAVAMLIYRGLKSLRRLMREDEP